MSAFKRVDEKLKNSFMRNCFLILIVLINTGLFVSCGKQYNVPNNIGTMNDTSAVVKFIGSFANGPYGTASGWAKITFKDGKYKLLLEETVFSDGPDLHVYVSKELLPVNFLDLGKLKSLTGDQLYDIQGTPNFLEYKYALIHSQQYNQMYGSSLLLQY